jgi:hypothetical protein
MSDERELFFFKARESPPFVMMDREHWIQSSVQVTLFTRDTIFSLVNSDISFFGE